MCQGSNGARPLFTAYGALYGEKSASVSENRIEEVEVKNRKHGSLVAGKWILLLLCLGVSSNPAWAGRSDVKTSLTDTTHAGYFDAHNHLTNAILPYWAYGNVYSFKPGNSNSVSTHDLLDLYKTIYAWYQKEGSKLGNSPFDASSQRYSLGARAMLATLSPAQAKRNPDDLRGALQRILTATPFTEFDSAYAFRGGPVEDYYKDRADYEHQLCKDAILELAYTKITDSAQFMNFIGGFKFKNGKSKRLEAIACYDQEPQRLKKEIAGYGMPVPRIHILFMTSTFELGMRNGGKDYVSIDNSRRDGSCQPVTLPGALKTTPGVMENALLGENEDGQPVYAGVGLTRKQYFGTVIGIDTAGPEVTCFTSAGMDYYDSLVQAVYDAAVKRHKEYDWSGKLVVHTHVGEGANIYYGRRPPEQGQWTFEKVFGEIPSLDGNVITNAADARNNISMLLHAISKFEKLHPDFERYIVFRLGHVTHASFEQAKEMERLKVEADVNLDSNLATLAYGFYMMPSESKVSNKIYRVLSERSMRENFRLNDLPHFLIPGDMETNEKRVGEILGNASLKYLMENHVRVLLGSDGGGVEHSSMEREYKLAASLVRYWCDNDPGFRMVTGCESSNVNSADNVIDSLYENVDWHLNVLSNNNPYEGKQSYSYRYRARD